MSRTAVNPRNGRTLPRAGGTAAERDRLRDAITRLQTDQARLVTLEDAKSRAHMQLRDAEVRLSDAADALQRANRDERSRLAYEFLNDGELADPVADAKATVNTVQAEVDKLTDVEAALAGEIDRVQAVLSRLRAELYAAMSEVVCCSAEYRSLIEQHTAAWRHLRTVKAALVAVQTSLHGQLPDRLANEAYRSEPLEERVGYPLDADFVGAWAAAMAQLENDAETSFPAGRSPWSGRIPAVFPVAAGADQS